MNQVAELDGKRKLWLVLAAFLAVAGAAVSVMTIDHHMRVEATGGTNDACNIDDQFSCDDVAKSEYSSVAGNPLGVWGLGYFLSLLVLLGVGFSGHKAAKEHLYGYVGLVGIGVVVAITLASLSAFAVGAYCINCMVIYGICAVQAVLLFWGQDAIPRGWSPKGMTNGGMTAVIVVAGVVALFSFIRPYVAPDEAPMTADDLPEDLFNPDQVAKALGDPDSIPVDKSAYSGLGEDYRHGNDDAKVVLVEFADFECPSCAQMAQTLAQIYPDYKNRVLFVFKNYPLDQSCNGSVQSKVHDKACEIAVLARCAGMYKDFWAYHDLAFEKIRTRGARKPKNWAREVGLTDEQITSCLKSKDIMAKIKDDIALGDRFGVRGTPSLFVNGQRFPGQYSVIAIRRYLDSVLEKNI